jgi:hypothetical protein
MEERSSMVAAIVLSVLLILAESAVLLAAVGLAIESDELRSDPNYSHAYEKKMKTASNVAALVFLLVSLLPTFLLARVAALRWPARRIPRSLGSFSLAMAGSYISTLMWLTSSPPDVIRAMTEAIRSAILSLLA